MNPNPARAPQQPPAPGAAPHVDERLCHLFRASLKSGCIHPLYLPILRYRHAQTAA